MHFKNVNPIIVIMHFVYNNCVLNIITCCMRRTTSSGINNGTMQNKVIGNQSPGINLEHAACIFPILCVMTTMSFVY